MTARGMGRGLAAILPTEGESAEPVLRHVPVELIQPNAAQPRKRFDPDSIAALAKSLADAGVVQPLIVRPLPDGRYELIAGERRWRAAREAKLETVPVILRDEDETQRLQTALIENVAREDLNPVEEARACAALVEDLGLTKEELGRRLGRSRVAISNLIRLLDLPDPVLELLEGGELSEGHGRAILQARGQEARRRLARAAAANGWSVRETERRAKADGAEAEPRPRRHPDEAEALRRAEEALEEALGTGVVVRAARGGLRAAAGSRSRRRSRRRRGARPRRGFAPGGRARASRRRSRRGDSPRAGVPSAKSSWCGSETRRHRTPSTAPSARRAPHRAPPSQGRWRRPGAPRPRRAGTTPRRARSGRGAASRGEAAACRDGAASRRPAYRRPQRSF
jgi:ParB family chromosome partitioning protein